MQDQHDLSGSSASRQFKKETQKISQAGGVSLTNLDMKRVKY